MKNFVISVKDSPRRNHVEQVFSHCNVAFSYFDAITPFEIHQTVERLGLSITGTRLTGHEIGCYLSHVSIWQMIVDQSLPYACIFEDDVHLGVDAGNYLNNTEWIPQGIDFIKIETLLTEVRIASPLLNLAEKSRKLSPLLSEHAGTCGYLMGHQSAQKILAVLRQQPLRNPVDVFLFKDIPHILQQKPYQLYPALAIQHALLFPEQNDMPSAIPMRSQSPRHSIFYKISREVLRPFKQFGRWTYAHYLDRQYPRVVIPFE